MPMTSLRRAPMALRRRFARALRSDISMYSLRPRRRRAIHRADNSSEQGDRTGDLLELIGHLGAVDRPKFPGE